MLARKRDVTSCATSRYEVMDLVKVNANFWGFVGAKIKANTYIMVHGARRKFKFTLLSQCTSNVHQIHKKHNKKHNKIKFLCSESLVGNTH